MADPAEVLDGLIRSPPFHHWLGVTAVAAEPGRAVLRIPPSREFVGNPFVPAIHGGITAALIDLAGGAATWVELQFPTPTIDMRVDYLRPAIAGRTLLAEARVKNMGKTVAFVDVDVFQPDDDAAEARLVERLRAGKPAAGEGARLVATGRCAYSVKDRELGPRGHPIG